MTCWGCGEGDDSDGCIASELCETCKREGIYEERRNRAHAQCPGHEFRAEESATLYNKEFPLGKRLPPRFRCKLCGMYQ